MLVPAPAPSRLARVARISPSSRRALWRRFEANDASGLAQRLARHIDRGARDLFDAFADHPLGDDWRDFAWEALHRWLDSHAGYVYVMVHPMHPGWVKIGQTRLAPEVRADSLTTEGVLGRFELAGAVQAAERIGLERRIHAALVDCPRHKEFFLADWPGVAAVFEAQAARQREDWERAGFGPLFEGQPQEMQLVPWRSERSPFPVAYDCLQRNSPARKQG